MAKKVDPETLTHEELLIAYRKIQSRLIQVGFRHRAALTFFDEMKISDEFSAWVSLKARQLGV